MSKRNQKAKAINCVTSSFSFLYGMYSDCVLSDRVGGLVGFDLFDFCPECTTMVSRLGCGYLASRSLYVRLVTINADA